MVSAAVVGLGIATVLTAGTVHIGLGAAAAAAVAGNDSAVVDWWKSKRRGVVHLDGGAVAFLLELDVVDVQVDTVRSAVPIMERADAYLTEPILREAYARNAMTAAGPSSPKLPANVGGFALLAAGLLLIAIVVIPEYIRDPVMRAGVVIASIGGILVGIALFISSRRRAPKTSERYHRVWKMGLRVQRGRAGSDSGRRRAVWPRDAAGVEQHPEAVVLEGGEAPAGVA